jgi:UDP-glucose 4-epimerase
MDLADAHTRSVKHLLDGRHSISLNLGTGRGTTVKELISEIENVSGWQLAVEYTSRRAGDSPELVADNARAKAILDWSPKYDFRAIIQTAWNWHSRTNVS